MNSALICLGANGPDADVQIDNAFAMLCRLGSVAASSPAYPSHPEYGGSQPPYLNRIVSLDTSMDYDDIHRHTKSYEQGIRSSADIAPLVAIDIDIVEWNGDTLRPADATARYFRKGLALMA